MLVMHARIATENKKNVNTREFFTHDILGKSYAHS